MFNLTKALKFLFISKVRIKALKYFLFHPDVPIHLRGAVRKLDEEINAVRRELGRLEEIKLLKTEKRGNRKYFSLDFDFPYFEEFLSLFHKAYGIGGEIVKNQEKLGSIDFAMLTSSYTRGIQLGTHDVDLIIIGKVELEELQKIITEQEKKLGKEVNYTVLKTSDFILRKKRRDAFVMELLIGNNVMLVGKKEDLIA